MRATLNPCSPAWVTQPPTTCSTVEGSMPDRFTTSTCAAPSTSAARRPESHPLRLPIGVRTASTITGWATVVLPLVAAAAGRPLRVEPVLEI